ncbi:MAG TPA: glutamine amidotransferase [Azospirillum sp.]|nr:glutamine amidotransferase [Azospirillum sp.]
MPRTALVVRHVHFEDLGAFTAPIEEQGYRIAYREAGVDDLKVVDPLAPDLLVILGGPIGAYEENRYPFVADEVAILERRLSARKPTLGICLGAQMMARALGARVYPGPAKEIGWKPVTLTAAGTTGPLRHLEGVPVLHWHGDTFDLPAGATLLASTEICVNQAFAVGSHALAFQFHPEASQHGFERWLIGHAVEIAAAGLSVAALRDGAIRFGNDTAAAGRRCLAEWLQGSP